MIRITSQGDWKTTEAWLQKMKDGQIFDALGRYGQVGVNALASATPVESGETAASWTYEIERKSGKWAIIWSNTHVVDGTPVVILLQLGHGTGTGGYVEGRDFINPALAPIFDQIADDAWRVVTT